MKNIENEIGKETMDGIRESDQFIQETPFEYNKRMIEKNPLP
jgi:hypothetical protein